MKNEFVPYELALRLKKIGFVEPCITFYSSKGILQNGILDIQRGFIPEDLGRGTLAPTFSAAFGWFRKNHNLNYWVQNATACWVGYVGNVPTFVPYIEEVKGPNKFSGFDTYEEAELACLEKLIEIIEQK